MSAPGCLNPLQKLQLVSCGFATLEKHRTLLFHTSTQVYACVFGCLFGQNSIFFCNFLVLNRHFYHNQRQNYCLLCLAPAFSSLAAAFCNTFHKVFLVPLSTSAQNHEKHQKNAKLGFSHASAIFFAEKHFVGCRYIYNKTLLTCTNDSPSKKVHFQNFHRP